MLRALRSAVLFPYTTLFRSGVVGVVDATTREHVHAAGECRRKRAPQHEDLEAALAVAHEHHRRGRTDGHGGRSEEHTSELQSQSNLVCRLLLEKRKNSSPSP